MLALIVASRSAPSRTVLFPHDRRNSEASPESFGHSEDSQWVFVGFSEPVATLQGEGFSYDPPDINSPALLR